MMRRCIGPFAGMSCLLLLMAGCGTSGSGTDENSVSIDQRVDASGIEMTLESLEATAFTTVATLEVVPSPELDIATPEIVPLGPENIDTNGFKEMPVNPGAVPTGSDAESATIQLQLGPVDPRADEATVTIRDLRIQRGGERDWRTAAGPWTFEFSTDDISTEPLPRSFLVDETLDSGEGSITIEQVLVAETQVAIAYSADLGGEALPMGSLLTVRTADGKEVTGASIPGPRRDATDTRMKTFEVSPAEASTIEIVPGRYVVTEEIAAEATFPVSDDVLGPVTESATQAVNADIELAGHPATVTRIRAGQQPDGYEFEIVVNAPERNGEIVYAQAPGGDDPVVTDDAGNTYTYSGGGFGNETTGLRFNGPIDPAADELTVSMNGIGREVAFDGTVTVDISGR